ncbi:MAG: YbaB/EbfC family nucleoid-associated protein [Proteobacteria bacterium]|jgi:DNA-binding YbaB/EbfC family protein|nr:YbaB/EbfC family nucleoid-associated protein [Pseudomonadota bacterium]
MQKQILKQMQKKLQDSLQKVQEELEAQVVEGTAGGGSVRVKVNGQREVLGIQLDRSVVDPENVELLEDLVLTAIKDGLDKAGALANQKMGAVTGGLNIPGLPNLF